MVGLDVESAIRMSMATGGPNTNIASVMHLAVFLGTQSWQSLLAFGFNTTNLNNTDLLPGVFSLQPPGNKNRAFIMKPTLPKSNTGEHL